MKNSLRFTFKTFNIDAEHISDLTYEAAQREAEGYTNKSISEQLAYIRSKGFDDADIQRWLEKNANANEAAYYDKLLTSLERYDSSVELTSSYSDTAFAEKVCLSKAVAQFWDKGEFDISRLKPISGSLPDDFSDLMRMTTRPYIPLSPEQHQTLMDAPYEYYLTTGGSLVTFGEDTETGSMALITIMEEHAAEIIMKGQENE
jgi:hypothetical protein